MNRGENKINTSEDSATCSTIVPDAANPVELTEDERKQTLSPDDIMFLTTIQDMEKRKEVISILKSAGLLPLSNRRQH